MGRGLGRGRGKGRFFGAMQELEQGMQCGLCCVCLMCICGPIFILVGMSYMGKATTDSRGALILSWNNAALSWESSGRAQFAGLSLSVLPCAVLRGDEFQGCVQTSKDTVAALAATEPNGAATLPDLGSKDKDKAVPWTPLFYSGIVTLMRGSAAAEFAVERDGQVVYRTPQIPVCTVRTVDVNPCSARCDDNSQDYSRRRRRGGSNNNQCRTCTSKCTSAGGDWSSSTGQCSYTLSLTGVALAVGGHPKSDSPWRDVIGFTDTAAKHSLNGRHTDIGSYVKHAAQTCDGACLWTPVWW